MTVNSPNPDVDFYFTKAAAWKKEIEKMRSIALACGLEEELKWGSPCYTYQNNNIVLIHVFKDYCAYLFFKGALMKDPDKILVQQTKNVQAARQIRFTNISEINKLQRILKEYINEAIRVEKSGQKVAFKNADEFEMAEEFKVRLKKNSDLNAAFKALTPGRQRAYLLYFSSAKQSATREARVEKCIPQILDGKGLND